MGLTRFGEFLRILRIQNHEVMGDMAKILEVKTPFLSAVENGKKNIPPDWIEKISNHYHLSSDEKTKLKEAADESRTQFKISMKNANTTQRRVAMQFARSFDKMDDDTAEKIIKLLSQKGVK